MMPVERQKLSGEAWNTVEVSSGGGTSVIVQATDPGAVGAGAFWLADSPPATSRPLLYVRDQTDSFWMPVTPLFYDAGPPEVMLYLDVDAGGIHLVAQDLTGGDTTNLALYPGGTSTLGVNGPTAGFILGGVAEKIGFWDGGPVVQPTHIPDPAGGATTDAEARTAINAILDLLQSTGLMAGP